MATIFVSILRAIENNLIWACKLRLDNLDLTSEILKKVSFLPVKSVDGRFVPWLKITDNPMQHMDCATTRNYMKLIPTVELFQNQT